MVGKLEGRKFGNVVGNNVVHLTSGILFFMEYVLAFDRNVGGL